MNSFQPAVEEALPADLQQLPRWASIVALMAFMSECLTTTLTGHSMAFSMLDERTWLDGLSLFGSFLGVPAAILWIGGYASPSGSYVRMATLIAGLVHMAWRLHTGTSNSMSGASGALVIVLGPLGVIELVHSLVKFLWCRVRHQSVPAWPRTYLWLSLLLACLGMATASALECTKYLFPATWDYHLYRIDAALGSLAAPFAALTAEQGPWLQTLGISSYNALVAALYGIVAVAMRQRRIRELNAWRMLVVPYMLAFLAYAWLPVSGPRYTFFDGRFPSDLPDPMGVAALQVIIPPAFRNGMPSMHLTASLLVWMMAVALRNRVTVVLASLLVAGTAWSTLALGEHYVTDLAVAIPFSAFLGGVLIRPQMLRGGLRRSGAVWLCGVVFSAWMLSLRIVPVWLSLHPLFVQALSAVGLVAACVVWGQMARLVKSIPNIEMLPGESPYLISAMGVVKIPVWVIVIFIISGFAGLVYEVVYAKALAVAFGSTAIASYTVLTVYMGGMALGAWIGGHIADQVKQPLHIYGLCEAFIGIYAALTPQIFSLIQSVYVSLAFDAVPDAPWLTTLRVVLGVVGLGLPTLLMGATLPLMFKYLRQRGISSRDAIARLYSANVVGAGFGAVAAGYVMLPLLGTNGAANTAAVVSLMVALYAIDRAKQPVEPIAGTPRFNSQVFPAAADVERAQVDKVSGLTAFGVLLVGGALTLGLEINSMHLLATVAGNSVYAFALMLGTFLTGLSLGSMAGQRLLTSFRQLDVVSFAQYGLAANIGLTAFLWDQLPSYFGSFGGYPLPMSFMAREAIRALICMLAMIPTAFCIGVSYPAAMSLAVDWLSPGSGARGLGVASGFNTLGNIVGVLLVGFVLLPYFGSRDVSMLLASTAFMLGSVALIVNWRERGQRLGFTSGVRPSFSLQIGGLLALLSMGSIALMPRQWDFNELASGSNVYFYPQNWGTVVDHAESVDGGLTSVARNSQGVTTLLTNGKFQGNDSVGGEMVAQESFALFPLLHTQQRESALIIGYGTGMTTRVFHEAGFSRLEVAELSRDIVNLANKYFPKINRGVSGAAGVNVRYTDGRNYLLTQSHQFDVVSIEITSIWFAGAANLYNRDFYSLAKKRLRPGGVLQQWVQLHHMKPIDLIYVIGSVRSEFKYIWLYVRGGQGIIVASNDDDAAQYPGISALAVGVDRTDERHPNQLRSHLLLSPEGVDKLITRFDPTLSVFVSTDKNLYLEYSTPKGNVLNDVVESNVKWLSGFEPVHSK